MSISVGVLGAARVVKMALIDPSAAVDGIEIAAVAARDHERAVAYAAEHGIARVHHDYDAILDDPDIDAVYIPTPAALHGYWMNRAIDAGKHVLCEKPFTANAAEAAAIARRADVGDIVVMEAFHSRYHPMWARISDLIHTGAIGEIHTARVSFVAPHPDPADIRWRHELGGGALMDLGVYPVRLLRFLFGEPEVRGARARVVDNVDAAMTAQLLFRNSVAAEVVASMEVSAEYSVELDITGAEGRLHVRMPYHPYLHGLLTLTTDSGTHHEAGARPTTYTYQLEAFRDAVRDGAAVITDAWEATSTMRVIDSIYRAAGMSPREPYPLA